VGSGVGEILTSKEMAIAGLQFDVFTDLVGSDQVEFLPGVIAGVDRPHVPSVRRLRPQRRKPVRAIPVVIRIGEGEDVVVKLQV